MIVRYDLGTDLSSFKGGKTRLELFQSNFFSILFFLFDRLTYFILKLLLLKMKCAGLQEKKQMAELPYFSSFDL